MSTRSGEEIQAALRAFVVQWRGYAGSEKAEAQTFLNELLDCYGVFRRDAGLRFEHHLPGVGYMDMFWPGHVLVEMKAPAKAETLENAQPQAERYWRASEATDGSYDAVRYVVLCSFNRLLVWDMRRPSRPSANLRLEELPEKYEALLFLAGESVEASFVEHHRELTREAAASVATLYQSLVDRSAAPVDEIQRFVMQSVWAMFAEDLHLLEGYPFQKTVEGLLREKEPNSAERLGFLFRVLNQKGSHNRKGLLDGTRYVNGELFANPAEVHLDVVELRLLLKAAEFDWRNVDPTIFGSLMEGVLGRERRWELGAHYTHEADILKIVTPTIVRPWRERIDAAGSPEAARELLDELCAFKVLDPACGCGNFLYISYRELRGLEAELKARIRSLAAEQGVTAPPAPWPFYPLTNMQGLDIERIAVLIARVTLWMGHKQMSDKYGHAEDVLPLVDLSGIRAADALRAEWPETDCIIGNPPFLGSQHVRSAFGDEYVTWLKREFDVGVKDFCVYWFRKAHDHLQPGQRAGLVGTNSISQNKARSASLAYVTANGGVITDAVSSQKWPGEAKVHVSLVNWVREPVEPPSFALDGIAVEGIDAALHVASPAAWEPVRLAKNAGHCFQGPIPAGAGFILARSEAADLLGSSVADYSRVVRPYLTAADITDDPRQAPSRWIIDFAQMPLEEALRYPGSLSIVRERVKPVRETVNRKNHRERWWQFGEPRVGLRQAVFGLTRYAVVAAHSKRLTLGWCEPWTLASNATMVFTVADDYSLGLLTARTHSAWAWARSSTLKGDLRYTPTSVFMTFPWPDPITEEQRERVADVCRRLLARRSEICLVEQIGLTKLYNLVDDGAYTDLKALHRELDVAVADCYGWPVSVAQDDAEIVRRLTALNREIAEGRRPYAPFTHVDGSDAQP
jgi:hypothetical protein